MPGRTLCCAGGLRRTRERQPSWLRRCGSRGRGFDVEADGEALLGAGEVDQGGTDDAVEGGVGVVEGFGAAGEAAEELLGVVEGGEEGAVAPKDVDVAGEAGGIFAGFGE